MPGSTGELRAMFSSPRQRSRSCKSFADTHTRVGLGGAGVLPSSALYITEADRFRHTALGHNAGLSEFSSGREAERKMKFLASKKLQRQNGEARILRAVQRGILKKEKSDFVRLQTKSRQRLRYLESLLHQEQYENKRRNAKKGGIGSEISMREKWSSSITFGT